MKPEKPSVLVDVLVGAGWFFSLIADIILWGIFFFGGQDLDILIFASVATLIFAFFAIVSSRRKLARGFWNQIHRGL